MISPITLQFEFYEVSQGLWKCRFPTFEELSEAPLTVMHQFFSDFSEALNTKPEPAPELDEIDLSRRN